MLNAEKSKTMIKTKIHTSDGIIYKFVGYNEDLTPFEEYNIRPICIICKKGIECICFNDNNSDDPYSDAVDNLQLDWVCPSDDCRLKYQKEDDPEKYKVIEALCNGDASLMATTISAGMPELEDGDYCTC